MKKDKIVGNIVSLVLGIISILSTLFWYIAIPTGLLAIIFGARGYKKEGSKLGLAGLITGIVGLTITIFIYISLIILIILGNMNY